MFGIFVPAEEFCAFFPFPIFVFLVFLKSPFPSRGLLGWFACDAMLLLFLRMMLLQRKQLEMSVVVHKTALSSNAVVQVRCREWKEEEEGSVR